MLTADAGILRPIGTNLPNLFHYYIGSAPGNAANARALMDSARAQGFTHARFIASGYWPSEMTAAANGWKANPTAYWAAFDTMVADARARGLRLVPSMLFNIWLWADLSSAPLGDVFTPGTPAGMLVEQYITEMVTRYANEPAIAMWELGNELNLEADLDHSTCDACDGGSSACGNVVPSLGTLCRRTSADNFFSCNGCRGVTTQQQDLGQFAGAIALLVRSKDPLHRPFTTGNGYPRPSAWHLGASPCPSCNWSLDSPAEYAQALAQLHPASVDVISVHHYPGDDAARFGSVDVHGVDLLARTQTLAVSMGKQLYVGEWGEPRGGSITCGGNTEQCGGDLDAVATRRIALGLVGEGVALSALWSWEFHQFCPATPSCYSVEPTDAVTPFLKTIEQSSGSCTGQLDGASCPLGRCVAGACRPVQAGVFDFDVSGDEQGWLSWTNCSGCTPGTKTRAGNALLLATNTLQCSGTCMYPGLYGLSPVVNVSGGHALIRANVRSSGASAFMRVIFEDAAGTETGQADRAIPQGSTLKTFAMWTELPAGTAKLQVRLEALSENAQLTVDHLVFETLP